MVAQIAFLAEDDRVRGRRRLSIAATLRIEGAPFDVDILDLSRAGFRVRLDAAIPTAIQIQVASASIGMHRATLIWSEGNLHGFAFDTPLPPNLVANASQIDTVAAGRFGSAGLAHADLPEPYVRPFPRFVRLGLLLGLASGAWALTFAGLYALLR